ncbi:hypothetical protein [uncultured Enterococcus sp.]|uniref:hypothetical protein n=1 Tax=uncultured Enterococcus sp. TaxID=167972 RepID=UPI002AA8C538|nr:hypothetical protein [uncultured Enterococcus sp.]
MTTNQEKLDAERLALAKKIHENEQNIDDLRVEQRQRLENFEESSWKLNQETEQLCNLYQELVHFGDLSADYCLADVQELSQQVQGTFRTQEEAFEDAYRTANKQLEDTNESLQREQEDLVW